jgi:hypothetical protein
MGTHGSICVGWVRGSAEQTLDALRRERSRREPGVCPMPVAIAIPKILHSHAWQHLGACRRALLPQVLCTPCDTHHVLIVHSLCGACYTYALRSLAACSSEKRWRPGLFCGRAQSSTVPFISKTGGHFHYQIGTQLQDEIMAMHVLSLTALGCEDGFHEQVRGVASASGHPCEVHPASIKGIQRMINKVDADSTWTSSGT